MTKKPNQLTSRDFGKLFPNEEACDQYLVSRRWPKGVHCPRCGSARVYPLQTMKYRWECPDCREGGAYRFSHLVGTIFENTKIDLRDWFKVIHLMLTAKKGISAMQVQRFIGFGSYKTAWYVCHRIRVALQDKEFRKLMGIVEVDETFIGGKSKNRHRRKRLGGTGPTGKTPIAGAVERNGNVVARVIERVDVRTLTQFVAETVSDKVSLLVTDNWTGYTRLGKNYPHAVIDHQAGEYVVGAVHTQTIEGFWSLIKRGVVGSYHKVSRKYLPLYVAEFQFRYNNRDNADIFGAAIAGC
jgi:transposase-like protein/IS1 family transposase